MDSSSWTRAWLCVCVYMCVCVCVYFNLEHSNNHITVYTSPFKPAIFTAENALRRTGRATPSQLVSRRASHVALSQSHATIVDRRIPLATSASYRQIHTHARTHSRTHAHTHTHIHTHAHTHTHARTRIHTHTATIGPDHGALLPLSYDPFSGRAQRLVRKPSFLFLFLCRNKRPCFADFGQWRQMSKWIVIRAPMEPAQELHIVGDDVRQQLVARRE